MPDVAPLGRSAVVSPGQRPPPGWEDHERLTVARVDAETADRLSDAWRTRRPMVFELTPGLGLDDPGEAPDERVSGLQPWEWPVDLDLIGERLHHALWANSLDGRAGGRPVHRWTAEAVALGASARPPGAGESDGEGDVVLPGGQPVFCDGGPLDASLAERVGLPVLHRISIEHRSLRPLVNTAVTGTPLAADQLAAVCEPRAAARVIAPAGSGKTRVLTERARLVEAGWGLPAEAVALVAYNVRAANEMRSRLSELPSLRIRTLNALALRLCGRRATIEEVEVRRILGGLVDFPRRAETDPAAPWIEALSRVRLGLAEPADIEDEIGDVSDLDRVARSYRAELASRDVADFDEQVTAAIGRLLGDPQFRRRSQRFARILLVDEFQDLTPAHLLLIRLLSGPAGSVYGVGDDDQTIYGYAGATPRWLVDFDRWFPGAANHPLEVNYRCPAPVVTAASNLLSHNAVRVDKKVRAAKPSGADSSALSVLVGGSRPSATAATRVVQLIEHGAEPADIAVLTRVNASLVPVLVLLRHAGLPVNRAVDARFLQRGGVRAALAWLGVAAAPAGALPGSLVREAARRPKRGMSQSLLDLVARRRSVEGLTDLAGWLESKGSVREADKVLDLASDVAAVRRTATGRSGNTSAVLSVVRTQIGDGGLDASASALDQWSHGAIAAHADDLAALAELAGLEPDPALFPGWLADQLAAPSDELGVTLASIHSVKGREWPHVVVHQVTDGLLPHRLAWDMEEERRVFHVGITRCVETVTVVAGEPVSPFVTEMDRPSGAASGAARRQPGTRAARARLPPPKAAGAVPAAPTNTEAWERLRAWRSERARAAGKPAYVVFDDRTLAALAEALPTTESALARIPGIGPVKLETYGPDLITIAEELRASQE